ncbi:MAG TPA: Gfo/Idh/MocA family oxidoreductase [Capsulimonadaceae bacterium]|jgi:predicted dehydrogenase
MHRVAIIGSGTMARVHANHWGKMSDVEVVAIASLDPDTLATLTASTGAVGVADALSLIHRPDIDIVDICVPTPRHKEIALASLAVGKHTFLEKPMARTLADCDELIAAHAASGVTMMVGHVVRFFPEYRTAHEQVKAGAVGNVAAVRASRLSGHPVGWGGWYSDPEQSGGVVLDMIIHDFDWLRWTFGEVDRVYAKGLYGGEYTGRLDYALVTLHFASGALGHVAGSWAHVGPFRTQFEICGDAGMIENDSALAAPLQLALRSTDASTPPVAVPESPLAATDDPYYRELRHFVDCIDTGRAPEITLADARAAVAIGNAAIKSIQTGKPVAL